MRVLHWHVHGSWSTAFVQGPHTYLVPVTPNRNADGRGRARTFDWSPSAVEIPAAALADAHVDVVVLQRPQELELTEQWLRRRPGREVPAVYVEHNTPRSDVPNTRHPMADRSDIPVVHVTPFNELLWDCGQAPTLVIEHGIPDPGYRYTGEVPRTGVVINEPVRRGRVTGTDLLPRFAVQAPLDVFGMEVSKLPRHGQIATFEDLPQARMHAELARRRVYLHPIRWTSLGLSLLEAMYLGMPVVALATTEALEAVPPDAGVVSTRVDLLAEALRTLVADRDLARHIGLAARAAACRRYSLDRFITDWDQLLKEVRR
ncbi:MAG: glycosyltransferase [Pseudonocardiales bacterium]|nr:glycosyltransferase [Pseudonocardiales bacterium]MBV9728488.1 glycosyltransferase [Pseudonocardiales bacterium]